MVDLSDLTQPPAEGSAIDDLIFSRVALPVVIVARESGLYSHIERGPASISQIASKLQLPSRSVEVLVVVSAALVFLNPVKDDLFEISDLGTDYLLPNSPYYAGGRLERAMAGSEEQLKSIKNAVISGGNTVPPLVVNIKDSAPDHIRELIQRMHILSLAPASGLAQLDIFEGFKSILDVGGRSGSMSIAIAANHPNTRCTIMALPLVREIAASNIEAYGLGDRVSAVRGDMFSDPWPPGPDAILFANIFHDWDVESCQQLARRAYNALPPGGTILVHEMLLNDDKSGPLAAACFSTAMLFNSAGKQYTFAELSKILRTVGFADCSATSGFGYYSLVAATK